MARAVARVSVVRYPIADIVVRLISDIAVRPVSSSRLSAVVLLPEQNDERIRAERTHETGDRMPSDTGDEKPAA